MTPEERKTPKISFQLVRTIGWYKENGQSTWGLGVTVDHFGDFHYGPGERPDTLTPEGWQAQIQLGTWALFITSAEGVEALEGPGHWPRRFWDVVRP